ncbi:MAG: tetratricopeptide repeat protein [bacterium]|nr:tetratricopeptide repeat protein [bacterium]
MKKTTLIIAILFAGSGISGLVYELVWIRLLSHLLGGTTLAISTVLAAFMGGLALGSHYFGKRVDSSNNPLRLYAILEIGVAVLGALVPLMVMVIEPGYIKAAAALPSGLMIPLRIVLTFTLLLPPTILMGGTLPVLSRFLVRHHDKLGSNLGMLYAVNTLGAVVGIALSGFVLIPAIGLNGSTVFAVAGNLIAGLTAFALGKSLVPATNDQMENSENKSEKSANTTKTLPELSVKFLAIIFAATGFAALGFELYWTRALHHFLGNSTYAFSAMLTTYLTGLAVGSWVGGRIADRVSSPARTLGWVQAAIALSTAATVPLIWNWLPGLDPAIINPSDWNTYLARRFMLSFAIMALPTFFSGMTFPLVNRIGIQGLHKIGGKVGHFYFANTAGSIIGSLVAGFLVLPLLGVRHALLATSVLSAVLAVIILFKNNRRTSRDLWPGLAALVLLILLFAPLSHFARPHQCDTQDPQDTVLFDREDPTAHTRVYRKPNGEMHMAVDGHHIGGTEPTITRKEKILAHLPMVLSPEAKHTLSVGLGSGVTLGTLGLYDEIEKMTCVEIVPGVIEGAAFFSQHHGNVLKDPRLDLILGDGIQHLLTTNNTYDIISSDSKLNPEYSGNSILLSLDYYRLCRQRLTDDGIMVQWLAQHFPASETETVIRSFGMAFEHMVLYWIDPNSMIIVGSPQPLVFDFDRFYKLTTEADVKKDMAQQNYADPYIMSTLRIAGKEALLKNLHDGVPNTWEHPTLEFNVLREVRSQSLSKHEDNNFLYLIKARENINLAVSGNFDQEKLDRYLISSRQFMLGYGLGGGTNFVANGREALLVGAKENPDDFRIKKLLQLIDQDSVAGQVSDQGMNSSQSLQRAQSQIQNSAPELALTTLENALKKDPENPHLIFTRVTVLRRLDRKDEALALCLEHLAHHPDDASWVSQTSIILSQLGRLDESLVYARKCMKLDPDSAISLNNLATTLGRLKQFEEAADAFARVHEMDPRVRGAAFFAAAAFSMSDQTERSAQWVETCLQNNLTTLEEIRSNPMLEALRNSPHWSAAWDE